MISLLSFTRSTLIGSDRALASGEISGSAQETPSHQWGNKIIPWSLSNGNGLGLSQRNHGPVPARVLDGLIPEGSTNPPGSVNSHSL